MPELGNMHTVRRGGSVKVRLTVDVYMTGPSIPGLSDAAAVTLAWDSLGLTDSAVNAARRVFEVTEQVVERNERPVARVGVEA